MTSPVHNLNINNYSLDEILGLFELSSYQISVNDLKLAKKRVLMLHPDKSKLDSKYFLFYKKAFDIIVQFYDNQHKQNKEVSEKSYDPNIVNYDEGVKDQVRNHHMPPGDFNKRFNNLFEDNNMGFKPDESRNEWFKQEKSDYNIPEGKMTKQGMNEQFQQIKKESNGLINYNGVQTIDQDTNGNNSLYDEEYNDKYVTTDPFSKLKFDDLRKVHRDQSILAVNENDFQNVKTFKSVDEFNRDRSQYSYKPLEKAQSDKILQEQQHAMQSQMMNKEYKAKLQTDSYAAKNKDIMSNFLLLHNK